MAVALGLRRCVKTGSVNKLIHNFCYHRYTLCMVTNFTDVPKKIMIKGLNNFQIHHNQIRKFCKGASLDPELTKQENSPKKRTLDGGVTITDITVGNGDLAKSGKMVSVYYSGKLKSSNKVFDKVLEGPGLTFQLGRKNVIEGWDIGVVGMKVGGKRIITCPPAMAYGARGYPPVIPPNSTLIFEVELKNVE